MRRYTDLGVLLDDNNRRPICRLWLNGSRKYLGLFDNEQRKETKVSIEGWTISMAMPIMKATAAMYSK